MMKKTGATRVQNVFIKNSIERGEESDFHNKKEENEQEGGREGGEASKLSWVEKVHQMLRLKSTSMLMLTCFFMRCFTCLWGSWVGCDVHELSDFKSGISFENIKSFHRDYLDGFREKADQ